MNPGALKDVDGWLGLGPANFTIWERHLAPAYIPHIACGIGREGCLDLIVDLEDARPGSISIAGERDMGLYDDDY